MSFLATHLVGFGAGGDSFLPTAITGLQLWVRSDLGITKDGSDLVATWADQSGNGRDLTEATNKPLWVASLINGHAALRFDGSNDRLESANFTLNQPLTIFIVSKNVSNTDGDRLLASDDTEINSPNVVQRAGPSLQIQSNAADGASVASDTTNFHYYKIIFNGTSSVISKDGGSDATDTDNFTNPMQRLRLANTITAAFANVEIAEVFIYNSAISGANLTAVNAYLAARYAL
jgi:hypothetical protein